MSSLKDWYRYVDSKARSRPEEAGSPERDRAAEERDPARPPAATGAASREGEGAAGEPGGEAAPAREATGPSVDEEGLDIWGGLFPQPRKPEPKPTTAPLRRPTARLDEVPLDLPFTRTPIEGPPPPQFEMPEAEVAIPRFDEFVSPFTAETAPVPVTNAASPSAGAPPASPPGQPGGDASDHPPAEGPPGPATALPDQELPQSALHREAAAPTLGDDAEASDVWGGEDVEGEEGQLRWRSPFRLPGPGRTVSSGAPSPKPEPVAPRQIPDLTASLEVALEETTAADPTPPRPAPGTEEWERERVERLARTFRETLRALEDSLSTPRAPASSPAAVETVVDLPPPAVESPTPEAVREHVEVTGDRLSGEASTAPVNEAPESVVAAAPPPSAAPSQAAVPTAPAGAFIAEPAETEIPSPRLPPGVAALLSPSPRLPVSAATPDVLRNIEEAALIRQRLPQHMAMLLRIPTNEVAQNSYKSPFRESREDLIGRLLDPQLTLEEAARILGVCPTTVRRYTNRGMLHCHRTPGNQRRFRMSDVLQFLEQYGDRIDRAAEARQMEAAA